MKPLHVGTNEIPVSFISPDENLDIAVNLHWITHFSSIRIPSHQSAYPDTRVCWCWVFSNMLHLVSVEVLGWCGLIDSSRGVRGVRRDEEKRLKDEG